MQGRRAFHQSCSLQLLTGTERPRKRQRHRHSSGRTVTGAQAPRPTRTKPCLRVGPRRSLPRTHWALGSRPQARGHPQLMPAKPCPPGFTGTSVSQVCGPCLCTPSSPLSWTHGWTDDGFSHVGGLCLLMAPGLPLPRPPRRPSMALGLGVLPKSPSPPSRDGPLGSGHEVRLLPGSHVDAPSGALREVGAPTATGGMRIGRVWRPCDGFAREHLPPVNAPLPPVCVRSGRDSEELWTLPWSLSIRIPPPLPGPVPCA